MALAELRLPVLVWDRALLRDQLRHVVDLDVLEGLLRVLVAKAEEIVEVAPELELLLVHQHHAQESHLPAPVPMVLLIEYLPEGGRDFDEVQLVEVILRVPVLVVEVPLVHHQVLRQGQEVNEHRTQQNRDSEEHRVHEVDDLLLLLVAPTLAEEGSHRLGYQQSACCLAVCITS